MRFLIASDFHLNERKRLEDFEKNLREIENISHRINPEPAVYIIVGDVFDKRHPTPLELKIFADHLSRVKCNEIQLIIGNHDTVGQNLTTLDWCRGINVNKVKVYKIFGKTIYFAHRTLSEAKLGPKEIHIDGISYKKLNYDVIVTGHIHKPQIVNKENPLVLVPGSIERVNFGERGEDKYIWLLDVEKGIKLKRYKLNCRPMYYIEYDLDNKIIKINDKEIEKGSQPDTNGAIIKATFRGKKSLINKLNYDKLLDKFSKAYSVDFQFEYSDVAKETTEIETYTISDKGLIIFFW